MEESQTTGRAPATHDEAIGARFSLRHPAARAAVLSTGSYGVAQILRFASNLILTRLLVPEVFGVMLIVNVVRQGLEMISDLGLGPSLIQNPRGEEAVFMRTAWTMNVIRSVALWVLAAGFAWPIARFYGEPILIQVIPVFTLVIIIDCLRSAQTGVLNRRLELDRLIFIELSTYFLSIVLMVAGAFYSKTVWPLVIGGLIGSATATVMTHTMLGGHKMRFTLDMDAARELFHFGKWLFVSSVLGFMAGQMDRIVLGKFMTMTALGVYSIAFMLSQSIVQVLTHLSYRILFPLYARTVERSREDLRAQTLRVRSLLMGLTLPPTCVLVVFGPQIIQLLYDDRYLEAGWMLQVLGVAAVAGAIMAPIESVLIASGDTFRHMLLQAGKSGVMLSIMLVGGYFYGTNGVIFGYATANFLFYPVLAVLVRRHGVWLPLLDLAGIAGSGALIAGGFWLKSLWIPG